MSQGGVTQREGATSVELSAPAKLTLSLRVTGVRPDGYHLLESEMVTLDLADTLIIGAGDELVISPALSGPTPRSGPDPVGVPNGPDNLVARALVAVGRKASVRVVKRVPPGAGLGGGSADAAAILRWAGCTDLAVAAALGSDVPFCVTGGRAMVGGVGDVVTPLPYEDRRFTLLLLPFGVDTGSVYRAWDRLADRGARPAADPAGNDLEEAAMAVEPRLGPWRERFEELTGRRPRLAGSGSTWFVEGGAEELAIGTGQSLQLGDDRGVLVSVGTIRPSS